MAAAALYMYFMKMRTGLPSEDIGNHFNVTSVTVQRLISQIRAVLKRDLVPNYVNYVRTREELIRHNTTMSNGLFAADNEGEVMLVCDGTYIFIDKSRNYVYQKKTYTDHKNRNYLKVMNVTACDGTIVYSIGPFPAGANDASILKDLFDTTVMFDNLSEGDVLLLDRGFRDVVNYLEGKVVKSFVVKMPACVQKVQNAQKGQMTTENANRSRLVTALRFVVETRNGHLKTIWKKFSQNWSSYATKTLDVDTEMYR